MVDGSWLKARGSCIKARGSRLMAHGQGKFGAKARAWGAERQIVLGDEP